MAYTNWQPPLSILFTGGIDTQTDEKVVPNGRLTKLENGIFVEHGALTKRVGYDRITNYLVESPQVVTSFKDELVLSAESKLYSNGDSGLIEKSDFENVLIGGEEVCQQAAAQVNLDQCETEILKGFTWATGAGVFYSIQEKSTGQWLVNNVLLDVDGTSPRCVAVNNLITFLWADTGATNIEYAVVTNNSPTIFQATGSLISDLHGDGLFAVATGDSQYYVAYKSTATNDIRCAKVVGSSVDKTIDTGEASVACTVINVCAKDDIVLIAYTNSAGTEINLAEIESATGSYTFAQTLLIRSGLTVVEQLTATIVPSAEVASEDVVVIFTDDGDIKTTQLRSNLTETENGVGPVGSHIASNAFLHNGIAYVVLGFQSALTLQNCYFLARSFQYEGTGSTVEPLRFVGQFGIRKATDDPGVTSHLPTVYGNADTKSLCLPVRRRLQLPTDDPRNTDQIVFSDANPKTFTLDFNSYDFNSVESGDALYYSGSMHWTYDGVNLGESVPMIFPEPDITVGALAHSFVTLGTTGAMAAGTYGYKIVYERRTHYNEVMRSYAIPFSVEVVGAGNDSVILAIPTLVHTNYDDWYIVIYRTTDGGITFHRVSSIDPEITTGNNRWVNNVTTSASVTFIDGLADVAITDNDQELTTGGLLNNTPIPASKFVARSKSRVYVGGGECEPNRVYFSKLRGEGSSVEFNDQLFIDINETGGPITGLATLNDQLLIFKEFGIYYVNGPGPNNSGQGDYPPAIHIATDSGCSNSKAIAEMPSGVMYKSSKGIYIVGLNTQVSYLGSPVEFYNNLTTESATLLPTQNAVVFLQSDGDALYYDYNFNQWSVFTNHSGVSATVWQGRYAYVQFNGDILVQNSTKYRDGTTPYAFKAKTGPITPLETLQGWFRAKSTFVLGEYFTPHKLRVDVYANRDGYSIQSETFDPSDFLDLAVWGDDALWGDSDYWGGTGRDYQVELYHHPQKFQSFQLEFTEIPDTTDTGKAFQLAELSIAWAPLDGPGRTEVNRRK